MWLACVGCWGGLTVKGAFLPYLREVGRKPEVSGTEAFREKATRVLRQEQWAGAWGEAAAGEPVRCGGGSACDPAGRGATSLGGVTILLGSLCCVWGDWEDKS